MHRALALERLRLSAPSCIYSREISSGERNILCLRFNMAMPLSSEAIQSLLSFSWRMDNIRLHKVAYLSFLLFLNVMKFSLAASYRANPLFVPNQIFPFTSFIIQNTSLPGKLIGFPASFRKFLRSCLLEKNTEPASDMPDIQISITSVQYCPCLVAR